MPEALGGRLQVDFLCVACNSRLGHDVDAFVKRDPAIGLAIHAFAAAHPEQGVALLEGLDVMAHSQGGVSSAKIIKGEARIRSERLADGSLIQPTRTARKSVETMLLRQGTQPGPLEEALRKFDSAPPDRPVEVAPGLVVTNWTVTKVEPDLSGAVLDPLLPLKIAFEFLALHFGAAIYQPLPPLVAIRDSLQGGQLHESISITSLRANRDDPIHGILLEGNDPHARVQIRLFGRLAYRVHFRTIAVGGKRFAYTHDLATDDEAVTEALE